MKQIFGRQIVPKLTIPMMEEVDKTLDNKPTLRKAQSTQSVTAAAAPVNIENATNL